MIGSRNNGTGRTAVVLRPREGISQTGWARRAGRSFGRLLSPETWTGVRTRVATGHPGVVRPLTRGMRGRFRWNLQGGRDSRGEAVRGPGSIRVTARFLGGVVVASSGCR